MIQPSELAEINSLNKHSHDLIRFKTCDTILTQSPTITSSFARLDAPVGPVFDIYDFN